MKELEQLNKTMTVIAEKLTILSMPKHLRQKQRDFFRIIRVQKNCYKLRAIAKREYDNNPTLENKQKLEEYENKCELFSEKYWDLRDQGCEEITND